jgi:hypothetical protein
LPAASPAFELQLPPFVRLSRSTPMSDRIRTLLDQIHDLETELGEILQEQENRALYRIRGKRIEFERTVRKTHRQLKTGLLRWFRESALRNALSAPFIYGMIVPLFIYDLSLTIYQQICFRLYRIPLVRRADYIVIDRHHLAYLNSAEKINCAYCGYANGLVAYAREITARTEQYWCPIKHARKVRDAHARYRYFIPYGEPDDLPARIAEFRRKLSDR